MQMSGNPEKIETAEKPSSQPSVERKQHTGSSEVAGKVAQVVAEGGEGAVEGEATGAERVSEVASERAGEQGGSGLPTGGGQKGDGDDDDQSTTGLVFDDQNLPAQDKMIIEIEKEIRKEIKHLEKQASKYRGGIFRSADYDKLNETVGEIRRKRKLLSTIAHMAMDALKNIYTSLFRPKATE